MPNKPEVKCVYWSHGRYDSDLQDKVWDEVVPEFFDGNEYNLMGIEDAGSYTDRERDEMMARVTGSPHLLSSYIKFQGEGSPEDVAGSISFMIAGVMQSRGTGSMLSRQKLLLQKWNLENPGRKILPLMESYPGVDERDRISALADEHAGAFIYKLDKEIYWRDFVAGFRNKSRRMEYRGFLNERNKNWVRMISDVTGRIRDGIATKILVTLGSDHRDFSSLLADEFGDRIKLHPDVCLESNRGESDWESLSDAEVLRKLFLVFLLNKLIFGARQNPQGYYAVRDEFVEMIKAEVENLSVETICELMDISATETAGAKDGLIESKPNNDLSLERMERTIHDSPVLEDRSYHDNNVFLYRTHLLYGVADLLGLEGETDPSFKLLRQAIGQMIVGGLMSVHAELYKMNIGEKVPYVYLSGLIRTIAGENPSRPMLWNGSKSNLKAGKELVAKAKKLLAR